MLYSYVFSWLLGNRRLEVSCGDLFPHLHHLCDTLNLVINLSA